MFKILQKKMLLLGLATSLFCGHLTTIAQTLPTGFTSEKLAPLQFPTAMGIAPDGRVFVCISSGGKGVVRIYKDGALLTTPFITISKDRKSVV